MDLSLERWAGTSRSEREAIARRLAKQLPAGFAFDRIRRCRMGDQQHLVALFRQGTSTFALIPGGPVILGYDADRTWEPTSDELAELAGRPRGLVRPRQDDPGMPRRRDVAAPLGSNSLPSSSRRPPRNLDGNRSDPTIPSSSKSSTSTESGRTRHEPRGWAGRKLAETMTDRFWPNGSLTATGLTRTWTSNWRLVGSASRLRTSGSTLAAQGHRPCSDGATTSHAIGRSHAQW